MKTCTVASLALVLAACAAPEASREKEFTQAATAPLSDLNLVNAEIPAILVAAQKGPYAPPKDQTCTGLAAELTALDSVLGPDLDTRATAASPGLLERGVETVGNAAIGVVRGTAEAVVPYRRWVRKLSGAERYSKEVAAAIAAGAVRRSFLKGLGYAGGCEPPAAPRR